MLLQQLGVGGVQGAHPRSRGAREGCGGQVLDVALHGEAREVMAVEERSVRLHLVKQRRQRLQTPP